MRFKVQVCVSVLFWLFSFARRDDKRKLKTVSLVTTVPLFNLTEPSLNEPVKTLEVQQLAKKLSVQVCMCFSFLLIVLLCAKSWQKKNKTKQNKKKKTKKTKKTKISPVTPVAESKSENPVWISQSNCLKSKNWEGD